MNCLTREPWMGLITYNQSYTYSPSCSACVSALCNNSLCTYIRMYVRTHIHTHACSDSLVHACLPAAAATTARHSSHNHCNQAHCTARANHGYQPWFKHKGATTIVYRTLWGGGWVCEWITRSIQLCFHTKNDYRWARSCPATEGSINAACSHFTGGHNNCSEADGIMDFIAAHQGVTAELADVKAATTTGQRVVVNCAGDRGTSEGQLFWALQKVAAKHIMTGSILQSS